jgi:hypothetical protein
MFALKYAISKGDTYSIGQAIRYGTDSFNTKHFGKAASCGHLHVINFFISLGYDLDEYYDCALIKSAKYGHLDIVEFLLNSNRCSSSGKTDALVKSAINKKFNALNYILHGIYENEEINITSDEALRSSIESGYLHIVKYFVDHGCKLQNTHLQLAVKNKHWPVAKYLVHKGCNIDSVGDMKIPICIDLEDFSDVSIEFDTSPKVKLALAKSKPKIASTETTNERSDCHDERSNPKLCVNKRSNPKQCVDKCVICLDFDRKIVLLTCKHFVLCAKCSAIVDKCPICRTPYGKHQTMVIYKT